MATTPHTSTVFTAEGAATVVQAAQRLVRGEGSIDELRQALERAALPVATRQRGAPRCPGCGLAVPRLGSKDEGVGFLWVEDIASERRVLGLDGRRLVINGHYDTAGWDESPTAERLLCACGTEFALPDGYDPDWV